MAKATKAKPAARTVKKAASKRGAKKGATTAAAPKAKASARPVAKKSPLAGMSLEAYVARIVGWQSSTVAELANIVRAAAPEARVAIKWGQPVFETNGPFAFVKSAKDHVTFGFLRGAEIDDPTGVLEGTGNRMRHMKIASAGRVDRKMVSAMVKQAVRLNREKGNPTIRK